MNKLKYIWFLIERRFNIEFGYSHLSYKGFIEYKTKKEEWCE